MNDQSAVDAQGQDCPDRQQPRRIRLELPPGPQGGPVQQDSGLAGIEAAAALGGGVARGAPDSGGSRVPTTL